MTFTIETIEDPRQWNDLLHALPSAHVLQTREWGEFKHETTGSQPKRLAFRREGQVVAMASAGVRRVGPLTLMYAPKGPVLAYNDDNLRAFVFDTLQNMARRSLTLWLKIDPDVIA